MKLGHVFLEHQESCRLGGLDLGTSTARLLGCGMPDRGNLDMLENDFGDGLLSASGPAVNVHHHDHVYPVTRLDLVSYAGYLVDLDRDGAIARRDSPDHAGHRSLRSQHRS